MVWIYGGGFDEGTTATYNGTALVAQSVIQTTPIVFVAIQYRVAIWGWAQGAQATANNATNLGLRDQIAALQWVQENIAAFGGDKEKVTLVGQSAGAISIALHYLNPTFVSNANSSSGTNTTSSSNSTTNNSTTTPSLFRGAIMQSGAMSTYPIANSTTSRQEIFDEIANLTGCTANVTSGRNVTVGSAAYNQSLWDCLKFANNETLLNATVQVLRKPENQFG
jgi:carboxylesterase type B